MEPLNRLKKVRASIEAARIRGAASGEGCVVCSVVQDSALFEVLRGGLLMLVRWFLAYPLMYAQYNIRGLQKTPWRANPQMNFDGSGILVMNHRNSFNDVLISQIAAPKWAYFLLSHWIFRIPVWGWITRFARALPVMRHNETRATLEQRKSENEKTFLKLADLLVHGAWISIFPEGASKIESKPTSFKPGAARVAFLAEEKAGWDLPLYIYVLGLNYENQFVGRSNVYAQWADPIDIRHYRDAYRISPEAAEAALLEDIQKALSSCALEAPTQQALDQAHRLAYQRGQQSFSGFQRALHDVVSGRELLKILNKINCSRHESLFYQTVGFALWGIVSVLGWPFRAFGRLCAANSSEEPVFMLALWCICLIVGARVSKAQWIWQQALLTWICCSLWLWGWRRGIVASRTA